MQSVTAAFFGGSGVVSVGGVEWVRGWLKEIVPVVALVEIVQGCQVGVPGVRGWIRGWVRGCVRVRPALVRAETEISAAGR